MKKNILIFSSVILVSFIIVICFLLSFVASWRWQKAVKASAGFPYQIGLTKVVIIPCVVSPVVTCVGGPLCLVTDPVRCVLYSDVSGIPAGGMGSNALFLNIAIIKAGLVPGGQLIAGGMSPVLMDSGILASTGGCFGCVTKNNFFDKSLDWVDKYIIAGFK